MEEKSPLSGRAGAGPKAQIKMVPHKSRRKSYMRASSAS
jgi:hypothetical protein